MATNSPRYVCAFRGRRDSYQVPLALAEADLLDQFVTDAYALPWLKALSKMLPRSVRAKVRFRSEPGLPGELVHCLWLTTVLEHTRHALGCAPAVTYNKLDRRFSEAAARRARRARSNLLLYSPYAWEAFTENYPHAPRKVLFQYHPHSQMENRILAEDSARYPGIGESFSGVNPSQLPEEFVRRGRDVWKHADLIFCASSFTRDSLLEAGCDQKRCRVIPYGIEAPPDAGIEESADSFHALFVGSGGQRKGLHHLLLAWQKARLPASSKLVLVCRVIDRGIEQMIARTPRVEVRRSVSQAELNRLYTESSVFVMPSLVEGFGQVYLEALAQGCPVLGTANTGLPDIGDEAQGIFLVAPGNVEELVGKLENLSRILTGNLVVRRAAHACVKALTWHRFRTALREHLHNGE